MAASSGGGGGGNNLMTYSQYKKTKLTLKNKIKEEKEAKKEGFVQIVESQGCEYEQHISIIKNPSPGSGSLTHFAFPELHPNARLKAEHEYLLLVSRTRTDEQGRRHSIAVPVIPPPDGVKFEGGYHVERNPINGAARLVPPDGKPRKKAKSLYIKNKKDPCKKLSLSTIDEAGANGAGALVSRLALDGCSSGPDKTAVADDEGKTKIESLQSEMEKISLNQDLESIEVVDEEDTEEEKKSKQKRELNRSDSKRKMRKRGFLHFLNHSIAH